MVSICDNKIVPENNNQTDTQLKITNNEQQNNFKNFTDDITL